MAPYILWLIAAVVALILELMSGTMFLMWVSGGCFVAGVAAALFPAPWVPWATFVVSSSVLLYFGLPLARRLREQGGRPSNVDRMVGLQAVVLETIDPMENTGRVRFESDEWRARSDHRIQEGMTVTIRSIEGTTLMVTDASPEAEAFQQ
jgi:membrane protein implicated in regulation of membrane protease activity